MRLDLISNIMIIPYRLVFLLTTTPTRIHQLFCPRRSIALIFISTSYLLHSVMAFYPVSLMKTINLVRRKHGVFFHILVTFRYFIYYLNCRAQANNMTDQNREYNLLDFVEDLNKLPLVDGDLWPAATQADPCSSTSAIRTNIDELSKVLR